MSARQRPVMKRDDLSHKNLRVVNLSTHVARSPHPVKWFYVTFSRPALAKKLRSQRLESQFPFHLGKFHDGEIQIFGGVRGGNLRPNPRLALRHYWVRKANHVNTFIQHRVRNLRRKGGISKDNWHNRMLAGKNLKTNLAHARAKMFCVRLELVAQRRSFGQQLDCFDGARDDGRSECVREKIRTR